LLPPYRFAARACERPRGSGAIASSRHPASAGAVGLCVAAAEVPRMGRAAAAVMLTAALYWAAMLPLWFFSDRYDLVPPAPPRSIRPVLVRLG
jgi:hypothetical protein